MKAARAAWVAAVVMAACGPEQSGVGPEPSGDEPSQGRVRVSAAASLAGAFSEIAAAFEEATPGADVMLNLAGSSALSQQILEGAPADVYASASHAQMDRMVEVGEVAGEPRVFAHNRLQIAVPPGNPARVSGLGDFAREELLLGLCEQSVPCGELARQALARADVQSALDTHEPNVRALLTKIEAGELDAGVVYATDVESGARVEGIDIPAEQNVVATYPIALLMRAPNPRGAAAFVEFVLSDAGRAILSRHGFASP
jgi:molybdate transport system substrate-binding protein